jgi:hypothetical protein
VGDGLNVTASDIVGARFVSHGDALRISETF